MSTEQSLSIQVQILLLRQRIKQQRLLIQQLIEPQHSKDADPFPRSLGMRLLQTQLADSAPWLVRLSNKVQSKESALLWSVALRLAQHWLQKKRTTQQ
ncbi:hypothetical protein EMM73_15355 [Rheinheimera sediminis]|uniref:hypothetical protein n=1 Tax=Rheinheimera sp. YQF-1 TaxID=2499626 RepID=UPI000FD74404|nr:hypothetical protein [Rheinheimera sp. YQF-1]RVT44866.1 hypothetical protein EMM73_15355 [Rheinheimera sp. YQF-1]